MARTSVRWLPAVVIPALIAAGVIAVPVQAGATVDLPDKTADEVLQLIATSTEDSFSGTVEKNAELGLPASLSTAVSGMSDSLPRGMRDAAGGDGGETIASALGLLSGSHEARVFASGPLHRRVQVKERLAERLAVTNGTDAWFYDSETNMATHVTLPPGLATKFGDSEHASELATPAQIADRILDALGPSTEFSVGTDSTVAGRTVYELVLTPLASGTLAESVSISVDSETGLPLHVSVAAAGQDAPAFEVGFTSIDLAAPAADLFEYAPGPDVIVEEETLPTGPGPDSSRPAIGAPVLIGTGWDAIVEVAVPSDGRHFLANPLLAELTTEVDGGRAFSTALLTVFVTDDGRVLAGSVPVVRLQSAATAT